VTGAFDRSAALRGWRVAALLLGLWAVVATGAVLWQALAHIETGVEDGADVEAGVEQVLPDRLVLQEATFADLPGWLGDSVVEALPALLRSCARYRFLGM